MKYVVKWDMSPTSKIVASLELLILNKYLNLKTKTRKRETKIGNLIKSKFNTIIFYNL